MLRSASSTPADGLGDVTRPFAAGDALARLGVAGEEIERGDVVAELVLLGAEGEALRSWAWARATSAR